MEDNNQFQKNGENLSIGNFLKEKREKRNLTIKHISQMTKINPTQIDLLEKDLLSKLPNRAYVAGYVKAYARALGASQEEALNCLDRTYRVQSPVLPTAPLKTESHEEPQISHEQGHALKKGQKEKLVILAVAGVMIAVTSLTLLFRKGPPKDMEKTPPKEESTPLAVATAALTPTKMPVLTPTVLPTLLPKILPTLIPTLIATSTPKATPKVIQTPVLTPTSAPNKSTAPESEAKKVQPIKIFPDLGISSPLNPIELTTTPIANHQDQKSGISIKTEEKSTEKKEEKKPEKKDDKKKTIFYKIRQPLYQVVKNDELSNVIPANIKAQTKSGKQNAYVRAEGGRTWITYKIDKEPVKQIFLKENTGVLLSGDEVRVFLGNANVAKVFINNQPVDMQLKRGIKNLVFPESSTAKFAVPLFIFDEEGSISTSDDYMKKKGLSPQ